MQRRQFLCGLALLPLMTRLKAATLTQPSEIATMWQTYRSRFMTADGRIVDTGNQNISHSEGQGTAMLAAAAANDKAGFDLLWRFTQRLLRPDGLFSWKWVPGQGIADANNATDGDLYIAWALVRASQQFSEPSYLKEAVRVARAIRTHCLVKDPHGMVILPGCQGFLQPTAKGTVPVVNLAYWVFPALQALARIDPAPEWQAAIDTGLNLLAYARFGRFELPADWLLLSNPVVPWSERPARFGYEAIRIPLFLYWGGYRQHPRLAAFARFAEKPGFPAWVDLNDKAVAPYAAPAGFEAVAQLARQALFNTPAQMPALDSDYFSASLTLLAALALSSEG